MQNMATHMPRRKKKSDLTLRLSTRAKTGCDIVQLSTKNTVDDGWAAFTVDETRVYLYMSLGNKGRVYWYATPAGSFTLALTFDDAKRTVRVQRSYLIKIHRPIEYDRLKAALVKHGFMAEGAKVAKIGNA